jgi:hypothetical protein
MKNKKAKSTIEMKAITSLILVSIRLRIYTFKPYKLIIFNLIKLLFTDVA